MNLSKPRRLAALALVATLTVGLGACGSDDDSSDGAGAPTETKDSGATGGDAPNMTVEDNDRAFGATNEIVEEALRSVTDVDEIAWEGSQIQLTFSEGTVDDSGAWTPCISAGAVLSDEETVLLRYPDGDLDCENFYDR